MRLLLDTHIIVWAASGVDAFEPRVAALLTDARNELWMSAVSAWELAMFAERGRLELRPTPSDGSPRQSLALDCARRP